MSPPSHLRFVIFGLSITSSWGNGHATTYRGLVRELERRGHHTLFLERDVPWYAANRDLPQPPWGQTILYNSLDEVRDTFRNEVRDADAVIVGSYVKDGVPLGEWVTAEAFGVTAFYDIDTPVTLGKLKARDFEYLSPDLLPKFDLYLSFTGGRILNVLEEQWGARCARPLYCSVDPYAYYPEPCEKTHELGYMGTYSPDRMPGLNELLIEPALRHPQGRFIVAGPQYPPEIEWPPNVERVQHLEPSRHRAFYNSQSFTLNLTRAEMAQWGWSPSVRLFEAAACGTPIISDAWEGLDEFFEPDREILVARSAADTLRYLQESTQKEREQIGARAKAKVLGAHTAEHRAQQLEQYVLTLREAEKVEADVR
jgi:spore maturation protein CgeB